MKQPAVGLRRIILAFGYSVAGLKTALRRQAAFRQELAVCVGLAPLALWVGRNAVELALLIGSLLWVLSVELLNSAIESVVDRIGTEYHELSGQAKDLGSAAVLLSILAASVIWISILIM